MSTPTAGYTAWKLAFEKSPIILSNGLVNGFPGKMLPIIALTEIVNFPLGLLGNAGNIGLDNFFASFMPMPGSTLLSQEVAKYPFANSTVAANATIALPTHVSMLMICPTQNAFGYFERLAVMMAFREALYQHNASGGTYIIATPSYIYTNCVFREMRDASTALTKQPQNAWQLDFERPLITLEEAEQAQNGLMSMLSAGLNVGGSPAWSGLATAAQIPQSLAGIATMPAQLTSLAANTASASALALAAGIAPL